MYIEVDLRGEPARLTLQEPADFKAFKIVTLGEAESLDRALEPLGTCSESDHAYLTPDAVAALAGPLAEDEDWRRSFDRMIGYAVDHGWSDDSGRIRAHIERR